MSNLISGFDGPGLEHQFNWNYSVPADQNIFIAPRRCRLVSVSGVPTVVGSDASAVTGVFKKCTGTTAPASGTAVHTGTYDFKGTANTVQALAVDAAARDFAPGDRLAFDGTGTMTAATGVFTFRFRAI